MPPPTLLTIAGSEPSGGAGIQADLKAFAALGCYGAAVITALTAQSTAGVLAIHEPPPEFVELQLRAVLDDFPIGAFKTGMLYNAEIIKKVAQVLRTHENGASNAHIVVDPVMISASGDRLLDPSAVNLMCAELFPLATIVTPGVQEVMILLSEDDKTDNISTLTQMCNAAKRLALTYGVQAVLLRGGHLEINSKDFMEEARTLQDCTVDYVGLADPEYPAILRSAIRDVPPFDLTVDVLYEPNKEGISIPFTLFARTRLRSPNPHGAGHTLSAAIACGLAKAQTVLDSTIQGIGYTHLGVSTMSSGTGNLNHLHSVVPRVLPLPSLGAPHPFVGDLIHGNAGVWKEYVQHPFVVQLGKGTLPRECFIRFIEQDYLYLQYYSRAYGLLAVKSSDYTAIQTSAEIMLHIARETRMHESFCAQWGISLKELASLKESTTTTAYGNFIIDAGLRGDDLSLIVALAACLLGYGEVGLWLLKEAECEDSDIYLEGNPYRRWIEDYSGEEYQAACHAGLAALESRIVADGLTKEKYESLKTIWGRCVELEKAFWDMALDAETE